MSRAPRRRAACACIALRSALAPTCRPDARVPPRRHPREHAGRSAPSKTAKTSAEPGFLCGVGQ
eukprot:4001957-Prymnesium_polylepis.1